MQADPVFVTQVMRDDRVWDSVCDDFSDRTKYAWYEGPTWFQYENYGWMMFRKINEIMWECHIAMLKGAKEVESFVHECLNEMRARGVRKFLAPIGDWNRAAIMLSKRCGFKEEGRIECAYLRDGKPRAMVMMGGY